MNDRKLITILTALMAREAKVKYDLGMVNNSNLGYNAGLVSMVPNSIKYVQDNYNNSINYPLGAEPKRGGFRR